MGFIELATVAGASLGLAGIFKENSHAVHLIDKLTDLYNVQPSLVPYSTQ